MYSHSDCLFYSTDQLMKGRQKEDTSKTESDTGPQSKQSNTQQAAEGQPVCVYVV